MNQPLPTVALAVLLAIGSSGAVAQPRTAGSSPAVSCDRPGVDRAACQRETRAAAREQQRRGLVTPSAEDAARNLRARCEPLPAEDRQACLRRMDGAGTLSGSVDRGGLLRELVVVEPPVSTPAPAVTEPAKP